MHTLEEVWNLERRAGGIGQLEETPMEDWTVGGDANGGLDSWRRRQWRIGQLEETPMEDWTVGGDANGGTARA